MSAYKLKTTIQGVKFELVYIDTSDSIQITSGSPIALPASLITERIGLCRNVVDFLKRYNGTKWEIEKE